MTQPGFISVLQHVRDLTRAMVDAAERQDIDALARLEDERQTAITSTQPNVPNSIEIVQLTDEIAGYDERIRALIEPWRLHIRNYLDSLRLK